MNKITAIISLLFIFCGCIFTQEYKANKIERSNIMSGKSATSPSTVAEAMKKAFVETFKMTPDYCNKAECVKIEDHPFFIPPAYIYYRATKSGYLFHGEYSTDDTISETRDFSVGRWTLINE